MVGPRVLARGSRVLTRTALKLRFGERLVVVQDEGSAAIASAIAESAEDAGAWVKRVRLDQMVSGGAGRPHRVVPEALVFGLKEAHASVFVASALHQETRMRQAMLQLTRDFGLRHAHLPGITEAAFITGMRLGLDEVARVGREVLLRVANVRKIQVFSDAGTALEIELSKGGRWAEQLGVLERAAWTNYPAGALYASPESVSGVFVADASLGEFFGAREGHLEQKRVQLFISAGRVVRVECAASPMLQRDIEAMLTFSSNSARVGLVAIGVNYGIEAPIGDVMVDQNIPGLHLGIGDPAGKSTGAGWSAPTCFAACEAKSRVVADGDVIVDRGQLRGVGIRRVSGSMPAFARPEQ